MYTTWGPVCGDCGHTHRTIEAARKCLNKHQRGCEMQGGYSDRNLREVSGRDEVQTYDTTRGPGKRVGAAW